jgi:hypothetical protein
MAATLTLTPAILGGIGPRFDWPKIRRENVASRVWSAWASKVVRARWVAAGLSIAVLFALIGVFIGINIGLSSTDLLAKSGTGLRGAANARARWRHDRHADTDRGPGVEGRGRGFWWPSRPVRHAQTEELPDHLARAKRRSKRKDRWGGPSLIELVHGPSARARAAG